MATWYRALMLLLAACGAGLVLGGLRALVRDGDPTSAGMLVAGGVVVLGTAAWRLRGVQP